MSIASNKGKRGRRVESGVESILPRGQARYLIDLALGVESRIQMPILIYLQNVTESTIQISKNITFSILILPFYPLSFGPATIFGGRIGGRMGRIDSTLQLRQD
jgi:hypothetical protein